MTLEPVSIRRIKAVIVKEFREIIRDPAYLGMVFLVPMFIMVIFGYGLTLDVKDVPLGVYDRDNTPLSRRYYQSFANTESFRLVGLFFDDTSMEQAMQLSRIRAWMTIPEGFSRRVYSGQPVEVQILLDGTFPSRAEVSRGYAQAIHAGFLEELAGERGDKPKPVIDLHPRIWFNTELQSSYFIVPGLIATLLMFYPALLTTLSIVREKESQAILNIFCSPIARWEFLTGKVLPYWVISLVNFLTIFAAAVLVFKIPYRGSYWLLGVGSAVYVFCTCGIGLLISVLVRTQVSGILITTVLTILPAFIYSGFFVPLSTAEPLARLIGLLVPATYYLDIIRGLFLKGMGWSIHWPNVLTLGVYGLALHGIAYKRFKKRL